MSAFRLWSRDVSPEISTPVQPKIIKVQSITTCSNMQKSLFSNAQTSIASTSRNEKNIYPIIRIKNVSPVNIKNSIEQNYNLEKKIYIANPVHKNPAQSVSYTFSLNEGSSTNCTSFFTDGKIKLLQSDCRGKFPSNNVSRITLPSPSVQENVYSYKMCKLLELPKVLSANTVVNLKNQVKKSENFTSKNISKIAIESLIKGKSSPMPIDSLYSSGESSNNHDLPNSIKYSLVKKTPVNAINRNSMFTSASIETATKHLLNSGKGGGSGLSFSSKPIIADSRKLRLIAPGDDSWRRLKRGDHK